MVRFTLALDRPTERAPQLGTQLDSRSAAVGAISQRNLVVVEVSYDHAGPKSTACARKRDCETIERSTENGRSNLQMIASSACGAYSTLSGSDSDRSHVVDRFRRSARER